MKDYVLTERGKRELSIRVKDDYAGRYLVEAFLLDGDGHGTIDDIALHTNSTKSEISVKLASLERQNLVKSIDL